MNKSFRKIISGICALLLILSLSGCSTFSLSEEEVTELQQDEPQVIVGQSVGQELQATYAADHIFSLNCITSESYNPYQTKSAWNKVVSMLVYEPLVIQEDNFDVRPNLVTSWRTEDGKYWVFYVDTDRTFHDGGVMTAADAVYSIQMAMNYGGPYWMRFRYVAGTYTLDQSSFVVELSRTNYRFYELMNIPCIEYNSGYTDRPPGTGPYKFSGSGRYLTLNKDYPLADQMPLDTIHLKEYVSAVDILQAFEDSYIDVVINDPNGMSNLGYSSTNIIKYIDTTSLHYLAYNTGSRVFGQSIFRAIMTYAIDRDAIVSEVMKGAGTATTVPIHPLSELYPAEYAPTLNYSEETFRQAMEDNGITDLDGDGYVEVMGQPFTINFVCCSDSGVKVSAARAIAKKLTDFGFNVNLRELGYDEYVTALDKGNFDIYYAEVRLCGDWDIMPILASDAEMNYGNVWDMALDEYMRGALASQTENLEENNLLLYQYIGSNGYITPICFEKSEVLYHRGVISGLDPTQDNVFYGIENWTVDLG